MSTIASCRPVAGPPAWFVRLRIPRLPKRCYFGPPDSPDGLEVLGAGSLCCSPSMPRGEMAPPGSAGPRWTPPVPPGATTRAAVHVHAPCEQFRSLLHILECRMSVQSFEPLQLQLPWPTVPDWHLKLKALSLVESSRNIAQIAASVYRISLMADLPGWECNLRGLSNRFCQMGRTRTRNGSKEMQKHKTGEKFAVSRTVSVSRWPPGG